MWDYIYNTTHGISMEAVWRAKVLLDDMLAGDSAGQDTVLVYVRQKLLARWEELNGMLVQLDPHGHKVKVQSASGFCLLWLECVADNEAGRDCWARLENVGLQSRRGEEFGSPGHVRLNMLLHDANWGLMMKRLRTYLETTN